jgi:hypothetical protein
MYCKVCGNLLEESDLICKVCGANIEEQRRRTDDDATPANVLPTEHSREDSAFLPNDEEGADGTPEVYSPTAAAEIPVPAPVGAEEAPVTESTGAGDSEFRWNVHQFPSAKARKTEEINFDWNISPPDFGAQTHPIGDAAANATAGAEVPEALPSSVGTEARHKEEADTASETVIGEKSDPGIPSWLRAESTQGVFGHPTGADDGKSNRERFFTFNKKNEEFQKLLDREYERLQSYDSPVVNEARNMLADRESTAPIAEEIQIDAGSGGLAEKTGTDAEAGTEPEVEIKAEAEPVTETDAEAEAENKSAVEAEFANETGAEPTVAIKAATKPEIKTVAEIVAEIVAEAEARTAAETKAAADAEIVAEIIAEAKAKAAAEAEAEAESAAADDAGVSAEAPEELQDEAANGDFSTGTEAELSISKALDSIEKEIEEWEGRDRLSTASKAAMIISIIFLIYTGGSATAKHFAPHSPVDAWFDSVQLQAAVTIKGGVDTIRDFFNDTNDSEQSTQEIGE